VFLFLIIALLEKQINVGKEKDRIKREKNQKNNKPT